MSGVKELIPSIRNKVKKLVNALQSLENDNNKLKEKQAELLQTIENQTDLIKELQNNNRSILIADSIKQTEGNSDVKKQVDEMVREIDKCIELLNK